MSRVFQTEEIETTALNQVSLNVKKGEFISVMGPSGCGKSTLLNIIGLLDNASSGSYLLLEKEMVGLTESQRAQIRKENIGFIFQNFNLIDELSVYDNIELP
ncbi:MAG: ATP-binding cassette domain-containing protein, partial [Myroides sp.]|nr:ATP-binding cassette domain-containing protein [Myroides sp.]